MLFFGCCKFRSLKSGVCFSEFARININIQQNLVQGWWIRRCRSNERLEPTLHPADTESIKGVPTRAVLHLQSALLNFGFYYRIQLDITLHQVLVVIELVIKS